jgi:tetratricopeptide (TPR) repeat protein
MSDYLPQFKFVRAVDLSLQEHFLLFSHDYGDVPLDWDSIVFACLVVWEKKITGLLPLFIMCLANTDQIYYIDGNALSLQILQGADAEHDTSKNILELSAPEMLKSKDESFRRIISEICTRSAKAAKDEPLLSFIKGGKMEIPRFTKLKNITDYCLKTMATLAQVPVEEEAPAPKPHVKLVKGMVLDAKFTILDIFESPWELLGKVINLDNQMFLTMKTFSEAYCSDEERIARFIEQAKLWINLPPHRNMAKAELLKIIDGIPFLFTEYMTGRDLENIAGEESLSSKSVIEIAIQMGEALDHAFKSSGMDHGDLEPRKCSITEGDCVKISGFGQARIYMDIPIKGSPREFCAKIDGGEIARSDYPFYESLPYMAPELFADTDAAGIRTDIYSYGVILYELLAGFNPFASESPSRIMSDHLSLVPVSPEKFNTRVPRPLAHLVLTCMKKDPELRYEDFAQIVHELKQLYVKVAGSSFDRPRIERVRTEDYWINRGLSLKSIGQSEGANKAFDEAIKIAPQAFRPQFLKGSSLSRRTAEGMSADESNWELWFWKAESLRKSRKPMEAKKCLEKALGLNDGEEILWSQIARLLADMGKREDALQCYEKALSLNPRAAEIWDYKGNLLSKMDDHKAAFDCFNESIAINPRFKWALHHRGIALFDLGAFEEALKTFKKVIDLDPEFCSALVWIGDCYSELGRKVEASEAYQLAIELEDDNIDAYLSFIQLLKDDAQWEQALKLVNRALKFEPQDEALLLDRAEILFRLCFCEEAQALCESLLKDDPKNKDAQLLSKTIARFKRERDILFREILATEPLEPEKYSTDLNSLLSVFCSPRDALSHLEGRAAQDANTGYLKGCLYFIEDDREKALAHLDKAMEDPLLAEKAQNLKKVLIENMGSEGSADAESQNRSGVEDALDIEDDLAASDSVDEIIIRGFGKIKRNEFDEARDYLRDFLMRHLTAHYCFYLIAKTYEFENDAEKAEHYYREFASKAPLSIGALREGLILGRDTDPLEAEEVYHSLIGSFPHECTVWVEYLKFLSRKGYEEKTRLLASGLLRDSFNAWDHLRESSLFWTIRGLLQLSLERYEEAHESFVEALSHEKENATALLGQGASLEGRRMFAEATGHLRNLMTRRDIFGISSYFLSDLYLRQKDDRRALDTIEKALHKYPDSLPLLYKKAQCLALMKRFEGFEECCEQIASLDDAFAPLMVLRSARFADEGEVLEATSELSDALAIDPGNQVMMRNLGFLHLQYNDHDSALSMFNDGVDINPLDNRAYLGLGIVRYLQKSYYRAFEYFQQARELNPQEPILWLYLGAVYFHLKKYPESEQSWEDALVINGRFFEAWINKGAYFLQRGDYETAQECADYAIKIRPDDLSALILKVRCLWKTGRLNSAAKLLEKAAASHEHDVRVCYLSGMVEFYRKNYLTGYHHFEKATRIDNTSAELWYNRAILALYSQNYDNVERYIERALERNPDIPEAQIARWALSRIRDEINSILQEVQRDYPEMFEAWSADFQESKDPLSFLKPMEIQEDPFTLPHVFSLALIEPFGLFHLLNPGALI